ncbi:unnamed protein product, partial [Ectocarpus sp. 12 AP-2014]
REGHTHVFFFAFVFGRFTARRKNTDSRRRGIVYSCLACMGRNTLDHASQRGRSVVPAARPITDGQSFLPTMPQVTQRFPILSIIRKIIPGFSAHLLLSAVLASFFAWEGMG